MNVTNSRLKYCRHNKSNVERNLTIIQLAACRLSTIFSGLFEILDHSKYHTTANFLLSYIIKSVKKILENLIANVERFI